MRRTTRRIVIAPDSFKESLSARAAAEAIARGVRAACVSTIDIDLIPVSDGGEGLVESLVTARGGTLHTARVTGPLGEPVNATWGTLPSEDDAARTAVIEIASAAGLTLVPIDRRDPTQTTTFGVGELIRNVLENAGATRLIIGIGGSATCDAGLGMAQALGAAVRLSTGETLDLNARPFVGADLEQIESIDLSALDAWRPPRISIEVASDVTNPLYGPHGAAAIYAPQKGATPEQVARLDAGLQRIAQVLEGRVGADPQAPGAGAAGGLGFGLVAFLGATLRAGVELVLEASRFTERLAHTDLVITGEGRLDAQTFTYGKAVAGVARTATERGVPVIALVGSIDATDSELGALPLQAAHGLVNDLQVTPDEALANAAPLLEELAKRVMSNLTDRPR